MSARAEPDRRGLHLDTSAAVGIRLSPPSVGVTLAWPASYALALSVLAAYLILTCAATSIIQTRRFRRYATRTPPFSPVGRPSTPAPTQRVSSRISYAATST